MGAINEVIHEHRCRLHGCDTGESRRAHRPFYITDIYLLVAQAASADIGCYASSLHTDECAMETPRDTRKLAAILVADVVAYSRMIAADESGTVARLKTHLTELVHPSVARLSGRIFKTTGDGFLACFDSAVDAVECAMRIQRGMADRTGGDDPARRIVFRIGINVGDVLVDGDDLQGGGVNVAARLEAEATPSGITVSSTVFDHIRGRADYPVEDLGEIHVKNIPYPIRAYRVLTESSSAPPSARVQPQSQGTSASALRRWLLPMAATAVLALIAAAVFRPWIGGAEGTPGATGQLAAAKAPDGAAPERLMLLVLPFNNRSGDASQEYFSDGVTEDVINALSRVAGFTVVARNTAFTLKGKSLNAQDAGREFRVRYLLEASIQKQGDRLRLNAQLIDTGNGSAVWADRFDRRMADVFVVQDELTQHIVGTVASQLRRREGERVLSANPATLNAFDLTLRARQLRATSGKEETAEARKLLERAIQADSNFVPAYIALYGVLNQFFINRWNADFNSPATTQQMLDVASKAVAIAPGDPMARATYAESLTLVGQHAQAVAQVNSIITSGTADTDVLRIGATIMSRAGEFDRSVAYMKRVIELDPATSPGNLASPLGTSLYLQGKYAEAADYSAQCVRRAPTNVLCRRWYVASLAQMGKIDEARREAAELMKLSPGLTITEQTERMTRTFRDPQHAKLHSEGLRKAGIPE